VSRIQCETARLVKNVLEFRTCSNTNNVPRSHLAEVDAFGVYSPDAESTYLVPLEGPSDRRCYLRLGPDSQ